MTPEEKLKEMDSRRALFGLFFAFHNRLQAVGDSFYEEITCKQFFLFACMTLFDESPTANEMAEVMGCSRQSVKEILNSLEKKGFVQMIPDDYDKRKKRIMITKEADILRDKYVTKEFDFIDGLYDGVSEDEIKETYRVISRMENNLKKMGENKK